MRADHRLATTPSIIAANIGKIVDAYTARDDQQLTTSGGGFVTKLSLTTGPLVGGLYRISSSFTYRIGSAGSDIEIRVRLDGPTEIHDVRRAVSVASPSDRLPSGFEYYEQFAPGDTPTVDVQFRRIGPNATVAMHETRISVERIAVS